ncbi:MAG: hypothetical protein H8E48_11970, partial [Chloroflexi bacterium]|nr:hypothetical protein [Chloroflexota bacterium]
VTSIAISTTVVVAVMGAKGVEPSLDAVNPDVADAFVSGLRYAFLMLGGLLLIGIAFALLRGERAKPTPVPQAEPLEAKSESD